MQSNKECMKDILRYISDNANVKIQSDDKNIVLPHIGLSEIISDVSKDDKYTKEEVVYNLLKCHKYHLIEASIAKSGNVIIVAKSDIYDITFDGERFLNGEIAL